jgi:hypothetical protein
MLMGAIIGLVVGLVVWGVRTMARGGAEGGGGMGAGLRVGTRAWEASMTLDPLTKCIASRRQELAQATDPARKDRLTRELAFLEKQVPELNAIVAANDGSPGRGYIGFDNLPSD